MKDNNFNLAAFRVKARPTPTVNATSSRQGSSRRRCTGEFVKGPIPLAWLGTAAKLPGKTLHVALAIMFEFGRRNNPQFRLSTAILARFGICRKAAYTGLEMLEGAALITAKRQHGKNAIVTIRNFHGAETPEEQPTETEARRA